jgi:ABC-type uncharacterized transport system involved in gliding motility auxiliary subunit
VDIGLALSRPRPAPAGQAPAAADQKADAATQRVVVVADGDFASNSFLGLGGNLQLALNIVNWLSSDDVLIDIPARTAPDLSLQLSKTAIMLIGGGFLLLLPALLLGSGLFIWFRRRRR